MNNIWDSFKELFVILYQVFLGHLNLSSVIITSDAVKWSYMGSYSTDLRGDTSQAEWGYE